MENNYVNSENYEIEVAISTDTILYSPFYLSYYGGDFKDTPFGSLNVNIVGTMNDMTFKQNIKLRGDGFATFCTIAGLSTASICDPSFLVFLKSANEQQIIKEFNKFLDLLESPTNLHETQDFYNVETKRFDIAKFNKILDNIKVIGGIISKIAFSVVGSNDLTKIANKYENDFGDDKDKFGIKHNINAGEVEFLEKYVKNKFIFYPPPSTGNCLGHIHSVNNNKDIEHEISTCDFGTELAPLYDETETKSLSISCDFVSIDYLRSKEFNADTVIKSALFEIQDLGADENTYLFTGIIANTNIKNEEKLRALLYGVDKNLYFISKFVSRKPHNTINLIKYFQSKLNYTIGNEEELFSLLIADATIRDKILKLIKDTSKRNFNFNSIIRYYAQRLINWNKNELKGLYYTSTFPTTKEGKSQLITDLENITKIRGQNDKSIQNTKVDFGDLIHDDLLKGWRDKEIEFMNFEKELNRINAKPKIKDLLLIFILPFLLYFKKPVKQYYKIWYYISHPSFIFIVGGVFILLEVTSSLCHIFDMHLKDSYFDILIPIFAILFWYLFTLIILSVLPLRRLFKLYKSRKYIYRNANH